MTKVIEVKPEDTFEVYVGEEKAYFDRAVMLLGPIQMPTGTTYFQGINFRGPKEALIGKDVQISVPYKSPPGTYQILGGGGEAPIQGTYSISRTDVTNNAVWYSIYYGGKGEIILEVVDGLLRRMKGNFWFEVLLYEQIISVKGSFDIYDR